MATIAKYNSFLKFQMDGTAPIDFNTDTIKVAITTSTYTPSATTHDYFNDITNEVSGTNYSSGGSSLASLSLTESSGTVTFDAADVTWSAHASGFSTGRYGIIYKSTGTSSTSPLFGYIDFVSDKGNVGGDLSLVWSASGIATWA